MGTKNRECWGCMKYKAFYTKGIWQFDKSKLGYCLKHSKIIEDKHGTCDEWRAAYNMMKWRKAVALKKVIKLSDSFLQIKQILLEDKDIEEELRQIPPEYN